MKNHQSFLTKTERFLSWVARTALASHLAVLGVASAVFAFAKPLADDFCRADVSEGVLAYVRQSYDNWSGRWLAHGVEVFLLSAWDPTVSYPWIAGILALFHWISACVFVRVVLGREAKLSTVLSMAGSYFVLFWSMHPYPGDSFYWFTGSVENQFNLALILLLWALLWRGSEWSGVRLWFAAAGAGVLGFLIPGVHELGGCILATALVAGTIFTWKTGRAGSRLWAVAAGFSIIGLLVTGLAPGNQLRHAAGFPDSYDISLTLWLTLWQAVKAGTRWVCDVKLLAATMLFVMHPAVRRLRPTGLDRDSAKWRLVVPAVWGLLLLIGFGVPSWIMGREMAGRTLSAVFWVFLVGWFANVFVFTRGLDTDSVLSKASMPTIRASVLLLYSLSIVATGNSRVAIHDLVHRAAPWHEAMAERYSLIREARGREETTLILPRLPDRPRILGSESDDITSDPAHWPNVCLASFFDFPSVRLGDRTPGR